LDSGAKQQPKALAFGGRGTPCVDLEALAEALGFVSSRDAHGHEKMVNWTGWLTLADKVISRQKTASVCPTGAGCAN
jgi:hypothetical protein